MVRFFKTTGFLFLIVLVSSCGTNLVDLQNSTQAIPIIQLNKDNFKTSKRVTGEATSVYVMGVGGFSSDGLYKRAMDDLLRKAKVNGKSRALAYITTDVNNFNVFPFYYRKKIILSAFVVDFSKGNDSFETLDDGDDLDDEEEYEDDSEDDEDLDELLEE